MCRHCDMDAQWRGEHLRHFRIIEQGEIENEREQILEDNLFLLSIILSDAFHRIFGDEARQNHRLVLVVGNVPHLDSVSPVHRDFHHNPLRQVCHVSQARIM